MMWSTHSRCVEVDEEAFEAECAFLRGDAYRRADAHIESRLLTARERYSDRSDAADRGPPAR
jgi:hypothetical protein